MSVMDVFWRASGTSDVADAFDEDEGNDLKAHVRACTRRYRMLTGRVDTTIRLLLFVVFLLMLNGTLNIKAAWDSLHPNPAPTPVSVEVTTHK